MIEKTWNIEKYKRLLKVHTKEGLEGRMNIKAKDLITMDMDAEEQKAMYDKYVADYCNEPYFKMEHVLKNFPDCDLYLILTKRGAGKTHQFTMMIEECIRKGKEFVLIRNTFQELEQGANTKFQEFNNTGYWPDNGQIQFRAKEGRVYLSHYYLDNKGRSKLDRRLVGYCTHLNSKNSAMQGASYDNVGVVIWDEANNPGQSINDLPARLHKVRHLYCSIDRGKRIPIFAFGNLVDGHDAKGNLIPCDYLLRALGIDPTKNLFYGTRLANERGENGIKMLYINTRELYTAATGVVQGMGIFSNRETLEALQSNTPVSANHNVVGELDFYRAPIKHWALVQRYQNVFYVIQLASFPDDSGEKKYEDIRKYPQIYVINVTTLSRSAFVCPIEVYTNDASIMTSYPEMLTFEENIGSYWRELELIMAEENVLYVGDESVSMMRLLYSVAQQHIEKYMSLVEKLKPKKKSGKKN